MGKGAEFKSWSVTPEQSTQMDEVTEAFDNLLKVVTERIPTYNARYLAIVKTKLEEASFFANKGISRPAGDGQ